MSAKWNDSVERWAERHDSAQRIAQELANKLAKQLTSSKDLLSGWKSLFFNGSLLHAFGVVDPSETKLNVRAFEED